MKPHNTTIPEQFNRLPEPWRSKAIARCEAYYGKKLDEIRTTFHEFDGKPFGFLQCAFPWRGTPEGEEAWKAISERGEFPPSDTPATTYRQLINERLPEPFRTQALENTPDKRLEQEVMFQKDLEPGFEFVSTLFTWSDSPQGHDYWSRVRRGDLSSPSQDTLTSYRLLQPGETILEGDEFEVNDDPDGTAWESVRTTIGRPFNPLINNVTRRRLDTTPEVEAPAPTPEARLDILESRIAVLEGLVIKPEAPVCGEVAGDTSDGDGYPSTPPDPGPGYRLVEKDELIEEGDEWFEDDGVWNPTKLGGTGSRKNIDTPLRRRVGPVLAVGKTYKLRNGDTVTITEHRPESEWPWRGCCQGVEHEWRDDGSWSWDRGSRDVRDIVSELPPAYRLLNPGETILASDEVYLRGEWEEMAGDEGVGETFDPEEDHPIRRRIKSYEDA